MMTRLLCQGSFEHNTFKEKMPLDLYSYDDETGSLNLLDEMIGNENYGFICSNKRTHIIYGVDTRMDDANIVTYGIRDNKLYERRRFPLPAYAHGLHCELSKNGRFLLVSYAANAEVLSLELDAEGDVKRIADRFHLPEGQATLPRQKSGPVPHQATFDESGQYLFVPDIHTDRLYVLEFNCQTGKMTTRDCFQIEGGQGPRHVAVHPNDQFVYLLTEMGTSVYEFLFNNKTGDIILRQKIELVPDEYRNNYSGEEIQAGEITINNDGRYLIVSTRNYFTQDGYDRIFVLELDEKSGEIIKKTSYSSKGKCPRMILLDERNEHLLVGNKDDDEIVSFQFDNNTGVLKDIVSKVRAVSTASMAFV